MTGARSTSWSRPTAAPSARSRSSRRCRRCRAAAACGVLDADGKSLVVVQTGDKQCPGSHWSRSRPARCSAITNPAGRLRGRFHSGGFARRQQPWPSSAHTGSDGADIYLCDLAGASLRRLTFDDRAIRGIAWTPRRPGPGLLRQSRGGWRLWRVPAYGGSPRDLSLPAAQAYYPAVAPRAIAWRTPKALRSRPSGARPGIGGCRRRAPPHTLDGPRDKPAYSPDGKKIADISDQSGSDEIWISDAEAAIACRSRSFKGPRIGRLRWSPDGKITAVRRARAITGGEVLHRAGAPGGKPARVLMEAGNASWSHDGKWIYFQSRGQIWKADGERRQSASHSRTQGGGAAGGIGGRQVRVLPHPARHLAHSRGGRRRRRRPSSRSTT